MANQEPKILIASNHPLKKRLFELLFQDLGVKIISPKDIGIADEPQAVSLSTRENALIKARFFCAKSGLLTIADDLSLKIDALGGAPGVFVRRWGGHFNRLIDDEAWLKHLLKKMYNVPYNERTAHWEVSWALVRPDGLEKTHTFTTKFLITEVPRQNYPPGMPLAAVRWNLEKHKHFLDMSEEERWAAQIREIKNWNIKKHIREYYGLSVPAPENSQVDPQKQKSDGRSDNSG